MSEHKTFTLDEIEQQTGFDKRTIAYYVQQGLLPKVGRRGPKTRYPQNFLHRLQFVNMIREKQDLGEVGSLTLAEIREILDRVPAETIADVLAGTEPLQIVNFHGEPPSAPAITVPHNHAAHPAADAIDDHDSPMIVIDDDEPSYPDLNRRVRLGMMDPSSEIRASTFDEEPAVRNSGPGMPGSPVPNATADHDIRPPRRYEDEIKTNGSEPKSEAAAAETEEPQEPTGDDGTPPPIEVERLGWFLARLQRAMTGDRRRRMGTTESWHRALITPELTISARNLKDTDAYLLDAVARILKKLLWEAWEE